MIAIFFFGFILAFVGWWMWCLIDAITSDFPHRNDKLIWVLIILLTPFVGAVVYTLVGRNRKIEPIDRGGDDQMLLE